MNIGRRIFFDQDGKILFQLGEMEGNVLPREGIFSIDYIDLEYGELDLSTHRMVAIDVGTRKPVLEQIPIVKTEEESRIEELENQLLLAEGVI